MVQIAPRSGNAGGGQTGEGSGDTERALERKREILEGASRVFRRNGLHASGMREIAAELGMHAGNLYYYFANKQELLAFCQEQALSRLSELTREIDAEELPADEALRRLIVGHLHCLNQATPGSLAHLEVEALDGEWRKILQIERDRYERWIRALVERGVEDGTFRPNEARITTRAILGALNWTVKWYQPGGGRGLDEIASEFAELHVRGLLADGQYFDSAENEDERS